MRGQSATSGSIRAGTGHGVLALPALLALLVLSGGCASAVDAPRRSSDAPPSWPDGGWRLDGGWSPPDLYGGNPDLYPALPDALTHPDSGCATGTVDHCSSCGDRCPGPQSSAATLRLCQGGQCEIQCTEENYDVNGEPADGCEFVDDLPIHDAEVLAADMGAFSDCDGPQSTSAVLPSDDRKHLKAPTERPHGRADYFKLAIEDKFGCAVEAKVKVSLAGLPSAATYSVTAGYVCTGGKRPAPATQQGSGGGTLSVDASTSCSTGGLGSDSGTLFVAVRKVSGPHSNAMYTVEVEP